MKLTPDWHNGAQVAAAAAAHSKRLTDAQRERNKNRARRSNVARQFTEEEAAGFPAHTGNCADSYLVVTPAHWN